MRKLIFITAAFFIGIAGGYAIYLAALPSRTVIVPELTGKSLIEAAAILNGTGAKALLLGEGGEAYDPSMPEGKILTQNPPAGERAKEESTVMVLTSKGPQPPETPSVLGKSFAEAGVELLKKGLSVSRVIHVHSDTVPEGSVVAQAPPPGANTGPVTLIVSSGARDVIYNCPDFKGMKPEDASALAGSLGLNTIILGKFDAVSSQDPPAGLKIKKGQPVYLR